MLDLSKRHNEEAVAVVKKSLYSKDVKTAIYTAFLLNYGYEKNLHTQLDKLEYDIVDEGLFVGGKYNGVQNKNIYDLCYSFFDRWIGGEVSIAYAELFHKAYEFSNKQF